MTVGGQGPVASVAFLTPEGTLEVLVAAIQVAEAVQQNSSFRRIENE